MIDGLKPYPKHKDSGVPWLGEVPEHWEVIPLKRVAWFKSGAGFPLEAQGNTGLELPFFKVSDMNLPGNEKLLDNSRNWVSRSTAIALGATVFPAQTILFPKVGGAMLTNKRRIAPRPCCIDNNLMGCVVCRGDVQFVFALLQQIDLGTIAKPGPVPAISEGEIREVRVVFPPLPEQTAIVRFLDWADRRIRRVICARQKRIELLEEYKQALVHQAVTGQIDVRTGKPYPRYKDSGVEWLGQVPEHWEVVPLCGLGRPKKVTNCADRELLSVYLHRGVIRFADVPDKRTNPTSEDLSKYQAVDYGDFVLNNQQAWRGSVGVSKYSGIISPAYLVLALNGRLDTDYADRLLQDRSMVDQYLVCSKGVGSIQRNLYWPHLRRVAAPVPPNTEQTAIVRFLDNQTERIDAAIAADRRAIDLLQEFRSRLVADVVTGKLDVREAAATLPDEPPEEAEPLDDEETADGEDSVDEEDLAATFDEAAL